MTKKVDIRPFNDCEWDSPELFPESHCFASPTHVDKVSGFMFCPGHAAAFEMLMNDPEAETVLEARYHARLAASLKLANEKSPVPVTPEKVVENDSNERAGSQEIPGAEATSVPDAFTD